MHHEEQSIELAMSHKLCQQTHHQHHSLLKRKISTISNPPSTSHLLVHFLCCGSSKGLFFFHMLFDLNQGLLPLCVFLGPFFVSHERSNFSHFKALFTWCLLLSLIKTPPFSFCCPLFLESRLMVY